MLTERLPIHPTKVAAKNIFFNNYNVLFLMNLHSPSKSNTNSTRILGFILTCFVF